MLGPDGELRALDEKRSPMIGAVPTFGATDGPGRAEVELECPAGSVLLLYTDGLTDVAGEDADERTGLLERTLGSIAPGTEAETVVQRVLDTCAPSRLRDDVALLAIRLED
jgi:serine phosphatase RsbU (regulator of sigma subunit)